MAAENIKFLSLEGLQRFTGNILSIIEENESVTAAAITDLDERLKNHTHKILINDESNIPDEFDNKTFEEILDILFSRIDGISSQIDQHNTYVDNLFDNHLGSKRHLPVISNNTLSNRVLFLQAVQDRDDSNSKPTWAELPPASETQSGIITTGIQSISGEKTLKNALTINDTLTITDKYDDDKVKLTINTSPDGSGNVNLIKFDDWCPVNLSVNYNTEKFTATAQGFTFKQEKNTSGIYFDGNIYQTKFDTQTISRPKTISIEPGIITKITLNYIETNNNSLKLTLNPMRNTYGSLPNGIPYSGKCYITVAQTVADNSTGLITLSDAQIPESIQYSKSSVIEVSITSFLGEDKKYYSWRYIYV